MADCLLLLLTLVSGKCYAKLFHLLDGNWVPPTECVSCYGYSLKVMPSLLQASPALATFLSNALCNA